MMTPPTHYISVLTEELSAPRELTEEPMTPETTVWLCYLLTVLSHLSLVFNFFRSIGYLYYTTYRIPETLISCYSISS